MPELPEVETVRRVMESALVGQRIAEVTLDEDPILLSKRPAGPFRELLTGARVECVGRKGKYWWLELDRKPWVFGHLGMAGWIRELGQNTIRLREHGQAPLDDENGIPRFMRLMLTAEDGRRIAFTDGRRLGRLWMADSPEDDKRVAALGFDCWRDVPSGEILYAKFKARKAPIKALLLDQAHFAGVGNWIADEALYHAGVLPNRAVETLSLDEWNVLRTKIMEIIDQAVSVGADSEKFPKDWLFHVRWGGNKGPDEIEGNPIVRAEVGGRTTAWVPARQK